MANKERVTYVRFVFSADEHFFSRVTNLSLLHLHESIDKYIQLCEDEIRQIYPNTGNNVDVINIDDDINAGETCVEFWDDPEGILGLSECETVIAICERVFEQRKWYEWKKSVSLIEAQMQLEIPSSVIRWVCAKELVNTNKSATLWRIFSDELDNIEHQVEFIKSVEYLTRQISINTPIACYLEDIKETPITTILPQEDISLLVASKTGFDDEFFEANSSLFNIERKGNRVDVIAEHFVNVVEWSLWDSSYSKAATTLQKQAERSNMSCKPHLPDSISFFWSREIAQHLTLQQCIEEFLHSLEKIISNAKFWLKGGLIWDEIYEQKGQELRFQREILEPLLRNMGYELVLPTHGNRGEHGRDFVFYEKTKFGNPIFYALQAKAGNVSGGANRDIDELLIQIDRALLMPLTTPSEKSEIYVSIVIIAISGEYTKDAEAVIRKKIPKYIPEGAIYLWEKHKIQSLIAQFPGRETD